tara:strand:+ start:2382 stop:3038 length:657 start_codon:yes stop_codon:yes gene_type:complete
MIQQRIIQFIDYKGISKYKFYKKTGLSNGFLDKKGTIGADKCEIIYSYFPEINLEWLLTGKGSMLKINNQVNESPEEYSTVQKGVPYYDVDFTASFLEATNNQQVQPDSYVSHPFFKDCEFVVRASGQSMAKLIKHGDAIGLTRIPNWMDFIPMGEIYAIVTTNNFRMIKIITKGETKDSFTLISKPTDAKKEEFPPQQISKNKILSIFKVQACAHLF